MDLETVYTSDKVDASESFQKEEKKQTSKPNKWKTAKTENKQKPNDPRNLRCELCEIPLCLIRCTVAGFVWNNIKGRKSLARSGFYLTQICSWPLPSGYLNFQIMKICIVTCTCRNEVEKPIRKEVERQCCSVFNSWITSSMFIIKMKLPNNITDEMSPIKAMVPVLNQ